MNASLELDAIIGPVARAVDAARAGALADVLASLQRDGRFGRDLFLPPRERRYARRLLHLDPGGAFVVVAMTWAPGQGSPLHDHAGLWGAEVLVEGSMRETPYDLRERTGDRYRFARGSSRTWTPGTVGMLIPPLEYHDFGNASEGVSYSLHVYGGDLTSAQTFTEMGDGWWSARRVHLCYDES
jgi:predicted metal-dependent enzyme (double-stranded beta helix superfamily)